MLCLQAWLQEFVWREADFDVKLEKRAAHNPAVRGQLMKEPLFCFETAVMPALLALLSSMMVATGTHRCLHGHTMLLALSCSFPVSLAFCSDYAALNVLWGPETQVIAKYTGFHNKRT